MATKAELQAEYKELYGEQPDESVTVKELNELIKAKKNEAEPTVEVADADPEANEKSVIEDDEPHKVASIDPQAEPTEDAGSDGGKQFVTDASLLKKVLGKKETLKGTYYYGELRK